MKKTSISFIIGTMVGILITSSISVVANNIYNVTENPFSVSVNGELKDIKGYNINDSTYFKLRDVGKYIGFDVGFSEGVITITNTNNIAVTTKEPETNDKIITVDDASSGETIKIDISNQNFMPIITDDDIYYPVGEVNLELLKNIRIDVYPKDDDYELFITDISDGNEVKLDTLDYKIYQDKICISKTDLETKVLPYDNK